MEYYLAIDIGASSGRHILGYIKGEKIILEEIYRFDNNQIRKNGHVCWDIESLIEHVIDGIKCCKELGKIPKTIGIDSWAVDYVLLDDNDCIVGDAIAYRDARTDNIKKVVDKIIPSNELYSVTGIQYLQFNTLYQLMAQKAEDEGALRSAECMLMVPEYLNFLLTGVKKNEYTNATSTNLVNAKNKDWDYDLIERLGLPKKLFGKIHMPGEQVGTLSQEIQKRVGFTSTVILPATHDTGSAFLAVPVKDENSVYISSGTWSLLGVELSEPNLTEESRCKNFTNEGGAWYRYRYLKNIMGLWMIQSVRRELNNVKYIRSESEEKQRESHKYSFNDLIDLAKEAEGFTSIVDVDHPSFLSPESMIEAVKDYCKNSGEQVPRSIGEVMQCIYLSLATKYSENIQLLQTLIGKNFTSINVVGGGCQDVYLNELTSQKVGLTLYAGPIEGTALGNLIVQFVSDGKFSDLSEARKAITESFEIKKY